MTLQQLIQTGQYHLPGGFSVFWTLRSPFDQPTRSSKSGMTKQGQQLTKKRQVTTVTGESSDGTRPSKDTRPLQNKHTSVHRSSFKPNEEGNEGKENAREEDPTIDEYHNMKGKREDDNSRSKSISESLHTKQFANPPLHVEQEQRTNCPRPQSMPTTETGPNISARPAGTGNP